MSKFKVGDCAVCLNSDWYWADVSMPKPRNPAPRKNEIVDIKSIWNKRGVNFLELWGYPENIGFAEHYFEKVVGEEELKKELEVVFYEEECI